MSAQYAVSKPGAAILRSAHHGLAARSEPASTAAFTSCGRTRDGLGGFHARGTKRLGRAVRRPISTPSHSAVFMVMSRSSGPGASVQIGDEFTNPVVREFQVRTSAGCQKPSRNRRSPPCKWRMSSIAIAHHRQAGEAESEREAAPLVRGRCRSCATRTGFTSPHGSSSTQPLCLQTGQPRATADEALNVELEPGLDEGEVAGTQAAPSRRA